MRIMVIEFIVQNNFYYCSKFFFFRELGVKLQDIKTIIASSDFDQADALRKHKAYLQQKIVDSQQLIQTIDQALAHITGEHTMNETELLLNFKHPKQIAMADYLEGHMGESGVAIIEACKENIKNLNANDIAMMQQETQVWCQAFKTLIEKSYAPGSSEAQALMDEYYQKRILSVYQPTIDEFL